MNAIDIYKAHYEEECSRSKDKYTSFSYEYTKYEWAATYIFDLYTYDANLDVRFVKDILEVCQVIIERDFEYQMDDNNYIKYILVCQLLYHFNWINWGTSIRNAWFEDSSRKDILEESSWTQLNEKTGEWDHYKLEAVPFSRDNLKELIKFIEEDPDRDSSEKYI